MNQGLLMFCLSVVGIIIVSVGFYIWQMLGPVSLSAHGWLAIIVGVVGSFLLGGGLMALSFYSAKSGHDAKVAEYDPFQSPK